MLTREILKACMPNASDVNIDKYVAPLNAAMDRYHITTPQRAAAFLAQLAHESGSLRYTKEIYSGEAYDVGQKAKNLGNTPENDGDGEKYVGRGPIQITGYSNYLALTKDIGAKYDIDFTKNPEELEKPIYGALAAGWFWGTRGLNELADQNKFQTITKRINGGLNGYDDRLKHWNRCKKVLGI